MTRRAAREKPAPPYGPTRGMIQGLQLLQRITPAKVDEGLLKSQGIAPRNEYKVIGALRFLGLIDEEGKPTERAHLLKTRGSAYAFNLQEIIRSSYADLFRYLKDRESSQEEIYNYFVAREKLGAEMAVKSARFFASLCQVASIDLGEPVPMAPLKDRSPVRKSERATVRGKGLVPPADYPLPFILAVTPETAQLKEEEMVELFRRIWRAMRQAQRY
ncbi:MAG: DUF5343 domain-containing protein [Chloroflexi bacterium]|nr:DUF5343 domain-containing protein [Chloroflexota bacterium]